MNFTQPRASVLSPVAHCPTPAPEQRTDCPHVAGPWHAETLHATRQHLFQSSAFVGSVKTHLNLEVMLQIHSDNDFTF